MHGRGGLWEVNSLNFFLSENCLNAPSYLNDNLAEYSILGSRPFCFIALNISCHSLLAYKVSVEKSDDSLMVFPLHVIFFCLWLLLILSPYS